MRPHAQQAEDQQVRITAYRHIIQRYLRYVLIRCTGYTNDKSQAQRMAVYALVTACLLSDKLHRLGQLGSLIEMMVKIAGEDPTPQGDGMDVPERMGDTEPVFVLDERMCEAAGAINALEQRERELLILHHIERLDIGTLTDAHGTTIDVIELAVAEAERQFIELLRGLSSWEDRAGADVHALLVDLADCMDTRWAEAVGDFALHYAAEWGLV